MIFVVSRKDDRILNRCDAWLTGGEQKMKKWAEEHGYIHVEVEITGMGDMVIWVD